MKKKLGAILLVVALVLALALPAAPAAAHLEGAPFTTELLAGQDIPVGTVSVWNDSEELHVKYQTTGGWEMTETHLYVGKTDPNTLTTAPGQFPYDDADATSITDTMVTYEIPLADIYAYKMQTNKRGKPTGVMVADGTPGVEPCNNVYIAAHAVVEKCETEPLTLYPELTWERSSEETVAVYPGYGAQWTEAQGLAIATPLTLVWDGGTTGQYFTVYSTSNLISWASWACTQNPSGKSTTGTDLRRFQATFDIPVGYSVTGGTLGSVNPDYENVIPMNDNIYIFANMDVDGSPGDELIFWGGTISVLDPPRTHFLGMERRPTEAQHSHVPDFPETDGWYMDGTIPGISSSLFVGGATNVLDVFAEEFWTGGGMHELGLTLQGEQITCETETAWGSGTDFDHPNWATYFEYHVQPGLDGTGGSTADWVIDSEAIPAHTGDYYYHLETAGDVGSGNEARIVIDLPDGTTLGDIDSISWWVWAVTGYPPHVDIYLDVDEDEVVDPEDVLTAEMYYNNTEPIFGLVAWCNQKVQYDAWLQTFELTSPDGFGTVDDTTLLWLCKLGGGPGDAPSGTLAQWQAGTVGSDPYNEMPSPGITGSAPVLYIEIEVDNWMLQSEAYVDDIAISLSP